MYAIRYYRTFLLHRSIVYCNLKKISCLYEVSKQEDMPIRNRYALVIKRGSQIRHMKKAHDRIKTRPAKDIKV